MQQSNPVRLLPTLRAKFALPHFGPDSCSLPRLRRDMYDEVRCTVLQPCCSSGMWLTGRRRRVSGMKSKMVT